jgi:hypothetical protein
VAAAWEGPGLEHGLRLQEILSKATAKSSQEMSERKTRRRTPGFKAEISIKNRSVK